jgi:UDP-glucose 4-epimerase
MPAEISPSLDGLRVLVTGGAGMIGSHLVDMLLEAGVREVVVLDDFSRGRLSNLADAMGRGGVTLIEGDVRDRVLVARAFEGIDVGYHLAAIRLTHCQEEPRLSLEVMADGTFNVIEAALATRLRRLVVASSASVYGAADSFPTTERDRTDNDRTFYGAAKAYGEGLLRAFHQKSGLDYVSLRPFNVYGPRMDTLGAYTEVLVRWMNRIAEGKPPVIFGEGSQTMDFVYIGDVARAFRLAGTEGRPGAVYNIASGVETSLKDLAHALLRAMDSPLGVEFAPARGVSAVPRRWADTARAAQELGFKAETGLDEGLCNLVAWWRNAGRSAA